MNSKFFTLILIVSFMVTTACKKEAIPPTNTELLTGRTWKMTGLTVDPALPFKTGGPAVSNWYSQLSTCSTDDTYKFNSTSYSFEEGPNKCNQNDPTIWESGTWSFNSTEKVILMRQTSPKASDYEYAVSELTQKKCVLLFKIQSTNGTVYTLTRTLEPN